MTVTRRFVLTRGLAAAGSTAAALTPGLLPGVGVFEAGVPETNLLDSGLQEVAALEAGTPQWPGELPNPASVDSLAPTVSPVGRVLQMPFTLGVASGDPAPDGFVLWTRLAPEPLAPDGLGGMPDTPVEVEWQVAEDPAFRRVLRTGTGTARRSSAHSVHVEVGGLPSGQEFFYRFRAAGHVSATGRTRTAPARGSRAPMRFATVACANWEHGWFTAYRHLADSRPDLVVSLGDYLYEGAPGAFKSDSGSVRLHVGGRTTRLAGYRQRHAQYKTDPDLQAAHAAAPWAVTYDDHEILNNWADETAARDVDQARFTQIRAAAMRAFYEHMPLRRASRPVASRMQMYRRLAWGDLATFHVLDTRQYRDDQACGDGIRPTCDERSGPGRTLLGRRQEAWLDAGLRASPATWDVLAQQVFFSPNWLQGFPWGKGQPGHTGYNLDCWDGYPAARERLLASVGAARTRNLAVLTGDWHTHWAAEIRDPYGDLGSKPLGVELVTSSISSDGDGEARPGWGLKSLEAQPYLRHFDQRRGFVLVDLSSTRLRADFRVVDYVTRPGAPARSSGVFVAEAGLPRLVRD